MDRSIIGGNPAAEKMRSTGRTRLRPPDLQEAGQAAHGGPGPVSRRLRARAPRRLPVGRVRPPGQADCRYELRLYELGASGEVADIQVQCVKCESKRRLSEAFSDEGREELARCRGRWPHLRKYDEDACEGRQRAILLGASNSWFPIMLSVLSIPPPPTSWANWSSGTGPNWRSAERP